jgi:hypothetical protein
MFTIEIKSLFPTRPDSVGEWCFLELFYHFCARALEVIHAKRDDATGWDQPITIFSWSAGEMFSKTPRRFDGREVMAAV